MLTMTFYYKSLTVNGTGLKVFLGRFNCQSSISLRVKWVLVNQPTKEKKETPLKIIKITAKIDPETITVPRKFGPIRFGDEEKYTLRIPKLLTVTPGTKISMSLVSMGTLLLLRSHQILWHHSQEPYYMHFRFPGIRNRRDYRSDHSRSCPWPCQWLFEVIWKKSHFADWRSLSSPLLVIKNPTRRLY